MELREIQKIWTAHEQRVSSIHTVRPVLQPGNWDDYDPFLLLMEDRFSPGAFDIHPHRGMETITYIIDGKLEHYDNATASGGILEKGDFQFMTAGRGVLHNETPPEGEKVHLLQLWVNLPREHKMALPRYQDVRYEDAPIREKTGVTVRVYSGQSGNVLSNTLNYTPITFLEISLAKGTSFIQELPSSYNGYMYLLEGKGTFGANKVEATNNQAMWLGRAEGEVSGIELHAEEDVRLVLFAGEPIKEPVVARGPFVMNSLEEIQQAYEDYFAGKFGTV